MDWNQIKIHVGWNQSYISSSWNSLYQSKNHAKFKNVHFFQCVFRYIYNLWKWFFICGFCDIWANFGQKPKIFKWVCSVQVLELISYRYWWNLLVWYLKRLWKKNWKGVFFSLRENMPYVLVPILGNSLKDFRLKIHKFRHFHPKKVFGQNGADEGWVWFFFSNW